MMNLDCLQLPSWFHVVIHREVVMLHCVSRGEGFWVVGLVLVKALGTVAFWQPSEVVMPTISSTRKRVTIDYSLKHLSCNTCTCSVLYFTWGRSRGGSGGSVEPPKLNVKMYYKHMVKKTVNQKVSTKMEVTLEQLNHFKLPLKTLEITFQRP